MINWYVILVLFNRPQRRLKEFGANFAFAWLLLRNLSTKSPFAVRYPRYPSELCDKKPKLLTNQRTSFAQNHLRCLRMQNLLIGNHNNRETCCTCIYHKNLQQKLQLVHYPLFVDDSGERDYRAPKILVRRHLIELGRHLNIKDHVAKWPPFGPFRMIYRNGTADYGDLIWQWCRKSVRAVPVTDGDRRRRSYSLICCPTTTTEIG